MGLGSEQDQGQHDWGTGQEGKRLGGGNAEMPGTESLKRRQLEAAERRNFTAPGVSNGRAAEMRDRLQKEELLGRIEEYYARKQLDMPIGLRAASANQLKNYWDNLHT